MEEHEPAAAEHCLSVELRAQRLDGLPRVLAALERPFVIERPDELRDLVIARSPTASRRTPTKPDTPPWA